MTNSKIKAYYKSELICKCVCKHISKNHALFKSDTNYYIFDKEKSICIGLDYKNTGFKVFIYKNYGINPAELLFMSVFEAIKIYCEINGEKKQIFKLSYLNKVTNTLYLKNGYGVMKITPSTIEYCSNGTDDVLFTDEVDVANFDYIPNCSAESLNKYLLDLPNYSSTAYLEPQDLKLLVEIYIFGILMPSLLRTKPIISTVGVKGSGKTSLLRMIGKLIHGEDYEVTSMTNKMDDLDTIAANKHLLFIDNMDTFNEAINDKLASYVTGVLNEKRSLYSNGDVYKKRVDVFIGISTRNPVYKRDDVAQRVIIIYLDPIREYNTEESIIDPLLKHRDEILSYMIDKIRGVLEIHKSQKYANYKSSFRMADFARFAAMYLDNRDKAENLLAKTSQTQKALVVEGDILLRYLTLFVMHNLNLDKNGEVCFMNAKDVFDILNALSDLDSTKKCSVNEFKGRYKDSIALGKRLHNIADEIREFIDIRICNKKGRSSTYAFIPADRFNEWAEPLKDFNFGTL